MFPDLRGESGMRGPPEPLGQSPAHVGQEAAMKMASWLGRHIDELRQYCGGAAEGRSRRNSANRFSNLLVHVAGGATCAKCHDGALHKLPQLHTASNWTYSVLTTRVRLTDRDIYMYSYTRYLLTAKGELC